MRLHSIYLLGVVASATAMGLWAAPSVSEVTARQRYPWNGLVDVNFTVAGDSGTKYDTSFTAKDVVGGTNLTMRTLYKSDGTAANPSKEVLSPGSYSWVWNAAADCGSGYKASRVRIEMNCGVYEPLYMVIDLSGGTNATSYPISYLDDVPQGGWSDVYKTTKLVMRRIKAGVNPAGGSMTNDMWVGVFEVTQKQWTLVGLGYPDGYEGSNWHYTKDDRYPIQSVGGLGNTSNSFRSRISSKCGINMKKPSFDEWEYACRSGYGSDLNNGTSLTLQNANKVAYWGIRISGATAYNQWKYGTSAPTTVGSYAPNAWGLYDMHGNVSEEVVCGRHVHYIAGGSAYSAAGGGVDSELEKIKPTSEVVGDGNVGGAGFRLFADVK